MFDLCTGNVRIWYANSLGLAADINTDVDPEPLLGASVS